MVVACLVCARPLDSPLTGGLHAGVAVLAVLAVIVVSAIGWGAWRIVQHDAAAEAAPAMPPEAAR